MQEGREAKPGQMSDSTLSVCTYVYNRGGGDSLVHFYGIDYMRHSSTTRVYSNKINKESKDLASFLYVLWHIIELNTPNNKTCYSMFYSDKKKKFYSQSEHMQNSNCIY